MKRADAVLEHLKRGPASWRTLTVVCKIGRRDVYAAVRVLKERGWDIRAVGCLPDYRYELFGVVVK